MSNTATTASDHVLGWPAQSPDWMRAGPSSGGWLTAVPLEGLDQRPGGEYGVSGDWAGRAGTVEDVIRRRFVRRLAGVLPGTRIGRVRWPRPLFIRPWPWHYWWQAHLLDCLVDAHHRAPQPWRAVEIAALARTVRLRNFGSWTNDYYDDIAWFGLAVQRAGPRARRSAPSALAAITAQLRTGWTPDGGGGIWWRRGDNFKNAPANGPAAILAARTGDLDFAARITDWIADTLIDPQTGLVRDGVRLNPDGTIRTVEATTYTYCQGVYLGACVELAESDGHPRWAERAATVLNAVATMAGPDKVIPGFDDGGDGGLFNGILARYLADTAVRRPELTALAAPLVLASAEAAWRGRTDLRDADLDHRTGAAPVFAPDWRQPARTPRPGVPEADLSVQLSAWMLLEAAARTAAAPPAPTAPS